MTKRVMSALLIVIVFIPFLIIGGVSFQILMSAIAVLSLYELLHIKEQKEKLPLVINLFAYILVLYFTFGNTSAVDFQYSLDYKVMSGIIFLFLAPLVFINNQDKYNISDALYVIASVLFIGLSYNLLIITRNYDLKYIIYLFLITTMTDTFALFTGMLVGNHKLSSISPKKTVEGLIGGTLMGTFVAVSFYHTVINPNMSLVFIIMITVGLSLIGQIGDLVFSSIKRYYGKKDFSDLIPGHGGILDRFDSMIFVVLAFVILLGII